MRVVDTLPVPNAKSIEADHFSCLLVAIAHVDADILIKSEYHAQVLVVVVGAKAFNIIDLPQCVILFSERTNPCY